MNPRLERLLKKEEPRKRNIEPRAPQPKGEPSPQDELFANAEEPNLQNLGETSEEPVVQSLFYLYETEGNKKWLQQDNPEARTAFNLLNKSLHPDRPKAQGVAVLAAKGTSFDDKREACVEMAKRLLAGECTGEVTLQAEPDNQFDPNAVAIISTETGQMLGYIPKAQETNKTYAEAVAAGTFCGGYIIEAKRSNLKNQENAMLLIATGWL